MLFRTALLGALAVLSSGVAAADTTSETDIGTTASETSLTTTAAASSSTTASASSNATEEIDEATLARLQAAQAAYPKCAIGCLTELIPASECTQTDIACLCTNEALNGQLAICVAQACTTFEGLTTKNVSSTMCGAPVRDKSAQPLYIGIGFGSIALFMFILRVCFWISQPGRGMGPEDYMSIAAVIVAGPPTAFSWTLVANGLGKDMWTLPLQNIENVLMYYYLGSVLYFACIMTTKLAVLLFIVRIFPDRKFRRTVYIVCGIVIAYGVSFIIATAFQCWPVAWAWEQVDDTKGPGRCNNIHLQGWFSAIFNIIIDIIMLVLPLKNLWGLQMQMKKKLMIMFMFSLGIFVTIVSIVRLHSLVLFANSHNITWDYAEAAWWSTVEIHVGIICTSLPAARQLFISMGASVLRSTNVGQSKATANTWNSSRGKSAGLASIGTGKDSATQPKPKHGDEGDFVPLVEYPAHKDGFGKGGYGASVTSSRVHDSDSV